MSHYFEKTEEKCFLSESTIMIGGQEIPFCLEAGNLYLPANKEEKEFSIFSFSYTRKDVEKDHHRPVLFIFNGGPTVNSAWLHLGFYGPRILSMGADGLPDKENPGKLRDNPDCLLDIADLVLYDPVNTGFSRLEVPGSGSAFLGDHEDASLAADFVCAWLLKHGRSDAPVYLSGESFGSTRASLMAWYLQNRVQLSGIIHIGPGYSNSEATIRPFKDLVPCAALKWYHEEGEKPEFSDWIEEVRTFLYEQYVPAYYLGTFLDKARKVQIAERLAYFTGLSMEYYLEHELRVDRNDFRSSLLSAKGLRIGSYDGRFVLPEKTEGEPFTAAFSPAAVAGMEHYLKEFQITPGWEYRSDSYEGDEEWDWNYNASPDMIGFMAFKKPMDKALAEVFTEQPKLRLFFGTGFYDTVATVENTRYSISHTDIPIERVTLKEYQSGHAVYADEQSRHQLAEDVRMFIMAGRQGLLC